MSLFKKEHINGMIKIKNGIVQVVVNNHVL
jgi:hypothetical protein